VIETAREYLEQDSLNTHKTFVHLNKNRESFRTCHEELFLKRNLVFLDHDTDGVGDTSQHWNCERGWHRVWAMELIC